MNICIVASSFVTSRMQLLLRFHRFGTFSYFSDKTLKKLKSVELFKECLSGSLSQVMSQIVSEQSDKGLTLHSVINLEISVTRAFIKHLFAFKFVVIFYYHNR